MTMPIPSEDRSAPSRDWGAYLSQFEWDHVLHLTSETPTTPRRLVRLFLDRFVRRAAFRARRPVPYFYAVESNVSGHPHLHALVAGSAHLTVRQLAQRWEAGFSRILVYDATKGAAFYVSKSLLDGCDDYDVSRRIPPRRRQTF